jgi:hypothetical protein
VLAAVFSARGSYATPQLYVDGLIPAVAAGAAVVAVSAAVALALPRLVTGLRAAESGPVAALAEAEQAEMAA